MIARESGFFVLQTINTTISIEFGIGNYFDGFSFIDFCLCAHNFNYKQPLSPLKIYQHKLPKDNQILQIELLENKKMLKEDFPLGWPGGPFQSILDCEWSPLVEWYTKEIKKFLCESRFRFCFRSSLKLPL